VDYFERALNVQSKGIVSSALSYDALGLDYRSAITQDRGQGPSRES